MRLLALGFIVGLAVGSSYAATSSEGLESRRLLTCKHGGALYEVGREYLVCYVPPGAEMGWIRREP